jgi:ubiquinone/menaquinone biosynthesis C-methylase UbiE
MNYIESQFVHNTYSRIAEQFDDSRYCVWNFVKQFLSNKGELYGIDIGCGNGKNMIHPNMVGIDCCEKFVNICNTKNKKVFYGCCCDLPFNDNVFDYSICVSVLHHLSTHERRLDAVREMVRVVKPGGEMLLNTWSVENQEKRHFIQGDNFVSWSTRPQKGNEKNKESFLRYYYIHDIYSINEFCDDIQKLFNVLVKVIYNEKGNWVVHLKKKNMTTIRCVG